MDVMQAIVHLSTIKSVSDALFRKDSFMAPIARFMSSYVEKEYNRLRVTKKLPESRN